MKNISIQQVVYMVNRNHRKLQNVPVDFLTASEKLKALHVPEMSKLSNPIAVARFADVILKKERYRVAAELAALTGYTLRPRKEITDYQYRNSKNQRIKINGRVYLLTKISDMRK